MQPSVSRRSISFISDAEAEPNTFFLVLVGIDGYLRGYQVHFPPSAHDIRTNRSNTRHCVLKWKTKLPGAGDGGLATCTASPFTPPAPSACVACTKPQAGPTPPPVLLAPLMQHPHCTHCRNALFQHELREQQRCACVPETESQADPGSVTMMDTEAYMAENWMAVFPPSASEATPSTPCTVEAPPSSSSGGISYSGRLSSITATMPMRGGGYGSPCTITTNASAPWGLAEEAEGEFIPLVRRPRWYWWEAPIRERLPHVDCLCAVTAQSDTAAGHGQETAGSNEGPMNEALGSWLHFQDGAWNRGSCPWHRLATLFHHEDLFLELDVLTGTVHGLADDDEAEPRLTAANEPTTPSGGSAATSRRSRCASPPSSPMKTSAAAPFCVPLLLRVHRTKLFCAPPSRHTGHGNGTRGWPSKRVTADLRDVELGLPLDLSEREKALARKFSALVRCAADGVVDIFNPHAAGGGSGGVAGSLFSSPMSSLLSPHVTRSEASEGRQQLPSVSNRIDELVERIEVEAATVGAFAVALPPHNDELAEPLVLPLRVHAAEMEEAVSVASGQPSRSWAVRDAFQASPSTGGKSNGTDASSSDAIASLVGSGSAPGFVREEVISGLLLQSTGTPMQLVQGVHAEDIVLSPTSVASPYASARNLPALERSAGGRHHTPSSPMSSVNDSIGQKPTLTTKSARVADRDNADGGETATQDSSSTSSTSSTTSDSGESTTTEDDDNSTLETATSTSTRISFAMPTRSESQASGAPPALHSGRSVPPTPPGASSASFFDDNFDPVLLLGRGASGAALLARHRTTSVFYAVKVLLARDYETERAILNEVRLHATLQNKHLVRYHACWSELVTPKRAMQLSFIGLCDREEALALPYATPESTPRGAGRYLGSSNSLSEEHLHTAADLTRAQGMRGLRTAHLPRRMHWGSLQLGAEQSAVGGPRLLIGEESFSGTSLSSSVPSIGAVAKAKHRQRVQARHAFSHGHSSSAAIVDVSGASNGTDDDDGDGLGGAGADTGLWARMRPPQHHLSLTELGEDDEEEDEDNDSENNEGASLLGGSAYREGPVVGARLIFLQMEYCQTTLAHHLVQRTRIDRAENLVILLQLVAGLRYLHQIGILHRDIKPTNIFVDFRCQLNATPFNLDSSDDEDDVAGDVEMQSTSPATGAATGDPHCTTLSCLPSRGSLWSLGSTFSTQPERGDGDGANGADGAAQVELREMLNSHFHRNSEEMLRELYLRRGGGSSETALDYSAPASLTTTKAADGLATPAVSLKRRDVRLRRDYRWLLERLVQVRLGDFGLAKPMHQQAQFDVHGDGFRSMNNANTVGVGSPVYSSPEQLNGRHCTSASDAFSLGVVMAEMYLMPTTIAERLVTLREVRDGVFPNKALQQQYPELSLVKALTNPAAARRLSLHAVHRQLKMRLMELLQNSRFTSGEAPSRDSAPTGD